MLNTKFAKTDIISGLVVFFVALPLCLGIALASGAPLFSGIIAGIIGGLIVGTISKSSIGVSGPAAGLVTIVLGGIQDLGAFDVFIVAVIIAGFFQIIFGILKFGKLAYFIPTSVIKGMLAAIGILIILKQLPHLVGFDRDYMGDQSFLQTDSQNTFTEIIQTYFNFTTGSIIIGALALILLMVWETKFVKKSFIGNIPGSIVCILMGVGLNLLYVGDLKLSPQHLVNLPVLSSFGEISTLIVTPNWKAFGNPEVWKLGLIIAFVGTIETLLSVEASDKLDPGKNITPTNKELFAQGAGNIASGLIGGLPVTQVIVRSSTNVIAGGRTKIAAIAHGFFLLVSVLTIASVLNMIPLAALAAILIMVGFKLASPKLFKETYDQGQDQFVPFMVTLVAIVLTDLLLGVLAGLVVGVIYVIYTNFKTSISTSMIDNSRMIKFNKDVFFYNKAKLLQILSEVKDGEHVFVDATKASFIDHDIFLALKDFQESAKVRNLKVDFKSVTRKKINFREKDAIISETIISE